MSKLTEDQLQKITEGMGPPVVGRLTRSDGSYLDIDQGVIFMAEPPSVAARIRNWFKRLLK